MENYSRELYDIPILMLVFNRPDLTKIVLQRVLELRPHKLYVVADGARDNRPEEKLKVAQTRALFDGIPKETELKVLFRKNNLGCKNSVSEGISWFFQYEEMGMILEDDCLPGACFFPFVRELLHYYKNEERIMHIGGNNFQFEKNMERAQDASYYFSNFPQIWGWATWRRAWKCYNIEMKGLEEFIGGEHRKLIGWEWFYYYKYNQHLEKVANNQIDTWDYQWLFTVWQKGGLAIVPNVNLVENIGFGEEATHTTQSDSVLSKITTGEMKFPIVHPMGFYPDSDSDNYTLGLIYGKNWKERIMRKIKSLLQHK